MTDRSHTHLLLNRLRIAQLRLAAVALMVMMCVTVIDVFLRYAFNRPIRGSYDMVEVTLVFFVFHGMSTAFLQRKSIVIDLVDTFAGQRIVTALIRLSDLLSIVALGLFAWAMLGPAMQAYEYGDRKLELNMPIYWLWIVALAGMVGAILCAFGALFSRVPPTHGDPAA